MSNRPRFIGINGVAQAGKDSIGRILSSRYGYTRVAFADVIRNALYVLNPVVRNGSKTIRLRNLVDDIGWEGAKQWPEVRRLLQVLGTEVGRDMLGPDIWVQAAMRVADNYEYVVFTDVRFPNEFDAIKAAGGEVWKVLRPGFDAVNDHSSESALDGYVFDRGINNTAGLGELVTAVDSTMDTIARELQDHSSKAYV